MSEVTDRQRDVLLLISEENYAHARDHEQLRAQVTALLVAAAFVLIGFAIDEKVEGIRLVYISVMAILIGVLNVIVVTIHNNRFDWHVSIARNARNSIAECHVDPGLAKKLSLSKAWLVVAALPIVAAVGLLLIGCAL